MPTASELYAMGRHLAYPVKFVAGDRKNDPPKPTEWHITAEGHSLLGDIMRENALEARAGGAGDWVQPPSRIIPGITTSQHGAGEPKGTQ